MKLLEWLGRAKVLNDDISSDAVRIASLELALRQANIKAMVWQVKAEDLQDKLEAQAPLVAYANRQKANRAKYDAKRRGK
jgi:hypothetical protein